MRLGTDHFTTVKQPVPVVETLAQPEYRSMAEQNQKVRFAISLFHEVERLMGALSEFHEAGLDADHLWLGGKRSLLEKQSALHDALAACSDRLNPLVERTFAFDVLPSGEALYGTTGKASSFMEAAVSQSGKSGLRALLEGQVGAVLAEVEQGALIVTVRTESPALQDHCMRILLRHARHMVFSRECRQGMTVSLSQTIIRD